MIEMGKYRPVRQVRTLKTVIRGMEYAVHTWGNPDAKPVFLLHGLLDTGMSFQFVADVLPDDWYLVAPDWRGFGDTAWSKQGYWFPDYLADLDVLLDIFDENNKIRLVGHSMGGNIACLYSGIHPDRVSHLVSLDVIGLPDSHAQDAPERYRKWLHQIKHAPSFSHYQDLHQLVLHINKLAPGIGEDRARFIAETWSKASEEGGYSIKADPAHKRVNPILYRREEARSCWRNISAKTMLVFGGNSRFYRNYSNEGYQNDFHDCVVDLQEEIIPDASHMLQLQQPDKLAELLHTFLKK
jgi:pimeloyl-ACP methyl ester carboxylesterase